MSWLQIRKTTANGETDFSVLNYVALRTVNLI